ncbi:receptor-like protein 20 [Lactuca sativa]|uniref:receptor-like protein 20 n=1 Tax=Lactuca sativa TaxID=4236 RepID=UPI001C6923F6|nr:receptor-like protein 20 [Lactuca sativa]
MALKLRRNNFHGNMMNAFLTGDPLTKLDLSENRFSGQLPRSLTNCTNLEILTLEDNSFHDTFPSWLGTLSKLQVLVLRSNKLYGSIQGSTAVSLQFPKLRIIDLSNNNFSGQLHQNYFQTWHAMRSANLENLEALDLSRNKLSGEIPQQLVQLGYFSIFNVSFNHLDGHIPQGKQFDTFENDSYEGNPRLCGQPLSKKCQYSKVSTLPPTSNVSESLLPSERIDWIIILCGVGSGLAVGIVIGSILYTRYSDRITKRKDRWVRPLLSTNLKTISVCHSKKCSYVIQKEREMVILRSNVSASAAIIKDLLILSNIKKRNDTENLANEHFTHLA